jgi:hypothetical protein
MGSLSGVRMARIERKWCNDAWLGVAAAWCPGTEADISHAGTARTKTYDVNVPFMQLERHGWDIHAVSADRTGG